MSTIKFTVKEAISVAAAVAMISICSDVQAQRKPIQIGGPNGIVMGGGMGFKVGGRNGIHLGGGQGAKFGPQEFGMHFGNGQGARFGGQNLGLQFGGGQGARFGSSEKGMQFGHGEGARLGAKQNPVLQFGNVKSAKLGQTERSPRIGSRLQQPPSNKQPVLDEPLDDVGPDATVSSLPPLAEPTSAEPKKSGKFSILRRR